jgi:ribosome-binding protein aMBF1 (putative translation factor)
VPKNTTPRLPAKPGTKPATKPVSSVAAKRKPAGKTTMSSKALSPRGRGSVANVDDDRLRDLFAENMRRIRLKRELSQDALGDLCDLDRTYVGSVERKRRNVSIRNIQRIADALGVDVRVLFDPKLAIDKQFGG